MKRMRFVWALLSTLAMLTSVAAAPMAGNVISLVEARNDGQGGVIFVFNVSGHFSRPELNGFVQVQGGDANYPMNCNQVDDETVQCTTSRKAGGYHVIVSFGGSFFWTFVPGTNTNHCYPVYDYALGDPSDWGSIGENCQDDPADIGDIIQYFNPEYDDWYHYEYMNPSVLPCVDLGQGYYYNYCPDLSDD